jgi:penicillin-binding protein 2
LSELPTDVYVAHVDRLRTFCGIRDDSIFVSAPHRVYFGGNAVSHATGWIGPIPQEDEADYLARGYSSGDLVGRVGVEAVYQDTLAGRPERVLRIVEPGGTVLREISSSSGSPASPITLTIDRDLQMIVTQAMVDAFNYAAPDWGSVSPGGAAIVIDVHTGAILALASYPLVNPSLYNPNSTIPVQDRGLELQQLIADPRNPLANRAVQEQFSPGSTFKLITAAAALNEGLIAPGEIFDCPLIWEGEEFGDTLPQRSDWRVTDDFDAAGEITPAEAIMASCTPFFRQYGARLYSEVAADTVPNYARRRGLARPYNLNIGFPEAPGEVDTPIAADAAISEAVGQGSVTVPPVQMAAMVAAIANGGTLYRPYLVQQIGGQDGAPLTESREPEILNTLDFQPGVLEEIQEGMCGVTTNKDLGTAYIRFGDPTGEYAPQAPYSVCGKTGTAQTAQFPNAWFIAYAPAEDPQIAIAVVVEQSLEGSQVSAPIIRRILDDYFGVFRAPFPSWWNDDFPFTPLDTPEGVGSG